MSTLTTTDIAAALSDRAREQQLLERCLEIEQRLYDMQCERDDWREIASKGRDHGSGKVQG